MNTTIDTSNLSVQFEPYYHSNQRIEVLTPYGDTIRGYVGKTTGWKPCYLLLAKSNSISSSELLTDNYKIIKLINRYR